jgi:acetolactate synthase-1/2/3 large subunit
LQTRRAADALAAARFPVILAGSGVAASGGTEELLHLAEAFAMPVATTQRGKGALPEAHPLALGVYGFAGHARALTAIGERADLVLAVGTSLGQLQTGNFTPALGRARLIQVDVDPGQIGRNYPVYQGLVGDAQIVLKELYFHVGRAIGGRLKEVVSQRQRELEQLMAERPRFQNGEALGSEASPVWPQRAVCEIQKSLPEETIAFWDSGAHAIWGIHYFQARRPQNFVFSSGFAAMGYSVAAAVGAKVARPDRPVVCVTGDGCFLMHGMEVATAVNHGVAVVWIVFNNGGMRMVEQGQKQLYGEAYSWQFTPVDFARLGRALGATGVRVTRPDQLAGAIGRALRAKKPTVIDVIVDPDQEPPAFTNANA